MNKNAISVKICGLSDLIHVQDAIHSGATHVGFLFAKSKRQVTIDQATCLAKEATGVKCVGVFVNPKIDELQTIMEQVPLTAIQLHGEESPEFCQSVKALFHDRIEVWKAISVSSLDELAMIEPYVNAVDAFLLDSGSKENRGGTGHPFNWELIPIVKSKLNDHAQLFIAGGLSPENVYSLLEQYKVDGVDVSSGVEINGQKSSERIQQFLEEVKRYESNIIS